MIKILITGPESSGKSLLTEHLAMHFNSAMVGEFARIFLEGKSTYQESDLLQIALGQLKSENEAESKNTPFLFCDTGVEVIKIWSQEKYKRVDSKIMDLLSGAEYDLVLLCKPNIPWQPDPLRENPVDRDRLFLLYVNHFNEQNHKVRIIDAPVGDRNSQAINYIRDFCEK